MKLSLRAFCIFKTVIITASLMFVSQASMAQIPPPAPPAVAAKSFLLLDFDSQQVIAESNSRQRLEPASITKVLTAYIVFNEVKNGKIKLDDLVSISERAWRMEGSRTFAEVGKQLPVEVLLKGMIVQSGNDATVALAEHIAGSEEVFVQLMNQRAADLGMKDSHFMNSSGLPDPNHYTTAHDLGILATAMISDFPEYYSWYSTKEFTFNNITQRNRNLLLWEDPSVDGLKTGHTSSAGYCLVASAKRENMRLISVILGAASEKVRANETKTLLNYGFRFYETHRLFGANEPITRARIWKGETEELALGLPYELFVTAPRGQAKDINVAANLPERILAPKVKGEEVGAVQISINGQIIKEEKLVALQDVAEGGLISRTIDEIKLMFE